MHDAGVPLYIGTDVFAPLVVPGASHWEEMRLFHKAGLLDE